jgi:hypothetical protein
MTMALRPFLASGIALVFTGCVTKDQLYCESNADCADYPGRTFCDVRGEYPGSDGVARTCIADPFDAGSSTADAATFDAPIADASAPDAVPDANPISFDFAFASEWTFSVNGPVDGWLLVVNTGSIGFDASTLEVRKVSDDHPTAVVLVHAHPSTGIILPDRAGGELSLLSASLLVDSGLVTEQRVDTDSSYLDLEFVDAPAGQYDIHAEVTVALLDRELTLPLVVHRVPGPVVYADPQQAMRLPVP